MSHGCLAPFGSGSIGRSYHRRTYAVACLLLCQRSQARVRWISQDRTRRQEVYKEFIEEASKCCADALQHDEADIPELVNLFATISRRLVEQADDQQGALTVASRSQSHQAYRRLNASFAHSQNFSAVGLSLPFREIIPTGTRSGSGVRRRNFTRSPNA
jgi:hypothetical protein